MEKCSRTFVRKGNAGTSKGVDMDTKLVNFRFSEDLLNRFSDKAKQSGLTMSAIIRALINMYVDGYIEVEIKVTVKK